MSAVDKGVIVFGVGLWVAMIIWTALERRP